MRPRVGVCLVVNGRWSIGRVVGVGECLWRVRGPRFVVTLKRSVAETARRLMLLTLMLQLGGYFTPRTHFLSCCSETAENCDKGFCDFS